MVVADGGEDVAEFALLRRGVADAVGREQGKIEIAGDLYGDAVACFFLAMQVTLEFHVNVVATEDADETVDGAMGFFRAAFLQRSGEGAFVATGQADESGSVLFEFVFEDGAFFFSGGAKLHARDESAEILVAGARGNEERKTEVAGSQICDFRLQIG